MPPQTPSTQPADPTRIGGGNTDALNGPPPTIGLEQPQTPPAGLSDLAPQVPPVGIPPAVMQGITIEGEEVLSRWDGIAQAIATAHPELTGDFQVASFALTRALQRLQAAAGSPTASSPTATGAGFPGGGLGSVGPIP